MEPNVSLSKENTNGELSTVFTTSLPGLEKFAQKLNEQPDNTEVKINKQAKNSKYLPISFIETKLDEIFAGLWQTENFTWQVIANEIVAKIELVTFHPVAGWIRRTGSAAVMIQYASQQDASGNKIPVNITDISKKITNTLVKDFPHLEAECIKSAAKKFGKMFGRDLNREFEDTYSPIYSEEANNTEGLETSVKEMKESKFAGDFKAIWERYPHLQTNEDFKKNYLYYQRKNVKQ